MLLFIYSFIINNKQFFLILIYFSNLHFNDSTLFRLLQLLHNCNGQLKLCSESCSGRCIASFAFNNQFVQPSSFRTCHKSSIVPQNVGKRKNEFANLSRDSNQNLHNIANIKFFTLFSSSFFPFFPPMLLFF